MMVQSEFHDVVLKEAREIIKKYNLQTETISENKITLIAKEYIIEFNRDRDGVFLIYIDIEKPSFGYNIFKFLAEKRNNFLSFNKNNNLPFVLGQVRSLVDHLKSAGVDILEGNKKWLNDYVWPPINR